MATTITRYVYRDASNTPGGDGTTTALAGANRAYASLSEAVAAEFALRPNLVTNDEVLLFICLGSLAETTQVSFNSTQFTTDTTRFVRIVSDGAWRHAATFDTAKYHFSGLGNVYFIGNIGCKVEVNGLQFRATASDPIAMHMHISNVNGELHVYNSLFEATTATAGTSNPCISSSGSHARKLYLKNNICYGKWWAFAQASFLAAGSKFVAYHNTVVGTSKYGLVSTSSGSGRVFWKSNRIDTPTGTSPACYLFSSTTVTSANNYSGDATSPDGASFQNKTFTWENAGANNYKIVSGDTFTGADLSADAQLAVTDDILGTARTVWYSGAHEFTAAGPTYVDRSAFFDPPSGGGGAGPRIGGGRIVS